MKNYILFQPLYFYIFFWSTFSKKSGNRINQVITLDLRTNRLLLQENTVQSKDKYEILKERKRDETGEKLAKIELK